MENLIPAVGTIISKSELFDYNPVVLSFVGDGVHTLFLRTFWSQKIMYDTNALHKQVTKFACAEAQADAIKALVPILTEDENFIYRKCKGTHSGNVPKHATVFQYRLATAFEGVVGFLYLNGQTKRLAHLLNLVYNSVETKENI